VYHSKDDRIRSHVLICWLALLLVRIAEVETGLTWTRIHRQMQQLNLIEFFNNNGRIAQHAELVPIQK
jgi:transposase